MTQLTGQPDVVVALDSSAPDAQRRRLSDLSTLTKPRITLLVVVTAYIGYAVGQRLGLATQVSPLPPWLAISGTLLGTALSCMGASVFNQVMERDVDARMKRTADRPLPAGRIRPGSALLLGLALSLAGVILLWGSSNLLVAGLGAFTIVSYALIYTPLKRVSSTCTIVGAVPGAMPPVIGFAAATGMVSIEAWSLFGILFLWQLPHFLAIAWLYREDYARAGLPMLPVIDGDGQATSRQILLGCLGLLPLGLWPTMLGISGMWYFAVALLAGLAFLGFGVALILGRTRRHARAMFLASLVYLPLVFAVMLLDKA